MANPSTTGPSGAGTEVLRRFYVDGVPESATTILQGEANHIKTVVSIIICERAGDASGDAHFYMYIAPDGGTTVYLAVAQNIGKNGTYIWNDKIALTETDALKMESGGTGTVTMDVWVTYIDQEF